MLYLSLDTLLKVSKTTYPQKLFAYDCVTLYITYFCIVSCVLCIYTFFWFLLCLLAPVSLFSGIVVAHKSERGIYKEGLGRRVYRNLLECYRLKVAVVRDCM